MFGDAPPKSVCSGDATPNHECSIREAVEEGVMKGREPALEGDQLLREFLAHALSEVAPGSKAWLDLLPEELPKGPLAGDTPGRSRRGPRGLVGTVLAYPTNAAHRLQ